MRKHDECQTLTDLSSPSATEHHSMARGTDRIDPSPVLGSESTSTSDKLILFITPANAAPILHFLRSLMTETIFTNSYVFSSPPPTQPPNLHFLRSLVIETIPASSSTSFHHLRQRSPRSAFSSQPDILHVTHKASRVVVSHRKAEMVVLDASKKRAREYVAEEASRAKVAGVKVAGGRQI